MAVCNHRNKGYKGSRLADGKMDPPPPTDAVLWWGVGSCAPKPWFPQGSLIPTQERTDCYELSIGYVEEFNGQTKNEWKN